MKKTVVFTLITTLFFAITLTPNLFAAGLVAYWSFDAYYYPQVWKVL